MKISSFIYPVVFLLFLVVSCKKPNPKYECKLYPQTIYVNHYQGLNAFPLDVFQKLYESKGPDSNGALGRNQEGYFHVRFQLDMGFVASFASQNNNETALDQFIKSVEYSFSYQQPNGNFDLVVPAELSSLPAATEADSASGVAFFMSALGNSLLTVYQNPWFQSLSDTSYEGRINQLIPKIQLSLNWLKSKESVLYQADAKAPNRLLFNALAFYTLGLWLNDTEAQNIAIGFVSACLNMQHEKGYFLELDGWDSSYQGVGLMNGFYLILAINNTDPIHYQLWNAIACGTDWQKSRVLKNGEISLEGNTRVYEGGEEFLGESKGIAWLDTYFSFLFMDYLSGQEEFGKSASDVRSHYE